MTTPDRSASTNLGRAAGLFVLVAVVTAGWLALNFLYPQFETIGIRRVVMRLAIHATLLTGLWIGLSRTSLPNGARIATWLAIAAPFTLWLALVWRLAINGAFVPGTWRVPLVPIAIFVPVLVGLVALLRSQRIAAVLDVTPPSWLIGIQVYRVFGGIFLVNWAKGSIPGAFALPAGTGDVLVGLLALPVALAMAAGTPGGRKAAIAWNLLGLLDFAIAIAMGALSSPGPLQMFSLDRPNVQLGTYPTVMIPTFAVPSSIILHVLSLWQLRRRAVIQPPRAAMTPSWGIQP